jgi:hypothetical protein
MQSAECGMKTKIEIADLPLILIPHLKHPEFEGFRI